MVAGHFNFLCSEKAEEALRRIVTSYFNKLFYVILGILLIRLRSVRMREATEGNLMIIRANKNIMGINFGSSLPAFVLFLFRSLLLFIESFNLRAQGEKLKWQS